MPKSVAEAVRLEEDVQAFLEHCRERVRLREMSPATVNRGYALALEKVLLPFCRREAIDDVEQLDAAALRKLTGELYDRELSRATVSTYLRSVNQFLSWRGITASDRRAKLPKRKKVVRDVLSKDEMRALEAAAPTVRDQLIIRIMADRGLREGEIVNLRTDDVLLRGGKHFLFVRGKTGERNVPIGEELYERLRAFISRTRPKAASKRLFLTSRRRHGDLIPLSEEGIYQVVKDAAARWDRSRRIYPHLLRHSAISRMVAPKAKLHPAYVAEIVGASVEVIAQHYVHPSDQDLYDAMVRVDAPDDGD